MVAGSVGGSSNPYSRLGTLAERLDLQGDSGMPWLLFVYFHMDILSSLKTLKRLSGWLGHQPSNFVVNDFLADLNDRAVRRHGLENLERPPMIERADLLGAITGKWFSSDFERRLTNAAY